MVHGRGSYRRRDAATAMGSHARLVAATVSPMSTSGRVTSSRRSARGGSICLYGLIRRTERSFWTLREHLGSAGCQRRSTVSSLSAFGVSYTEKGKKSKKNDVTVKYVM